MLIIYSLAITFLIFCFFNLIGKFFINKKKKENTSKTIIFGYSIFLLLNYNLYFLIYLDLSKIILFWLIFTSFIILFLFLKKKILTNFSNFFFLIFFLILVIYILPAYYSGEQFYVFRGNHWDLFSYLSISSLFNLSSFNKIDFINDFNFFLHFEGIESLIYSRPLTSLILAIFLKIKFLNVYFLVHLFKSILVVLSAVSLKYMLNSFKLNTFGNYLLIFIFPFSFWVIYIFEIEALAHLASLPIFLLIIAELKNLTKFNTKNLSYVIYFSVLNASLFLIYPEIFLILASIIFICLLIELKNKKFKNLILFKSTFIFIFFVILLTITSFKTNYIFLYEQIFTSIKASNDWWGYFGSFILGKENLVLEKNFVIELKQILQNDNLISAIKYIYIRHIEENYYFFYTNIIPSFFGFYYLSVGKISNLTDVLNFIGVIFLILYIVFILKRNLSKIKNNQKIILNIVFFIFLTLVIISFGNFWLVIKLYFYLFPFIFIFIVVNFNIKQKKDSINSLAILLLAIFPIYKFIYNDNGVGRLDSFPSIIDYSMKKNFNWKIEPKELSKCEYIIVDTEKYFEKSYLIVKFLHEAINSNIVGINQKTGKNNCKLIVTGDGFNVFKI